MSLKNRILIIIIILSCFTFSCKKNLFDFENISSIDASGQWGISLFSDEITISELLTKIDSIDNLVEMPDGTYSIINDSYSIGCFQIKDSLSFPPKSINGSGTLSINGGSKSKDYITIPLSEPFPSFSFASEIFDIEEINIKNGEISLSFQVNFDAPYAITLQSSNILMENGEYLSVTLSNNSQNATIDISNCHIYPGDNNSISFSGNISLYFANLKTEDINYSWNIGITETVTARSIVARISPFVSNTINVSVPFFDFSEYQIHGDINMYDIKLLLFTKNSLNIPAQFNLTSAELTSTNEIPYPIISEPQIIDIPISPNSYTTTVIQGFSAINIIGRYDKLKIIGNAVINPNGFDNGPITITDTSKIDIKGGFEIPIKFQIDDAYYIDTFANPLFHAVAQEMVLLSLASDENITVSEMISAIQKITLRMQFKNEIPLDFGVQVSFYDSQTQEVKCTITENNNMVSGCYGNLPAPTSNMMFEINGSQINDILESDKIILKLQLKTQNQPVQFNNNQNIGIKINAKVLYNTQNIVL